jgi:hypothetical protein
LKIKSNIALSDSGFVFDPTTGNSFTTNPLGLRILVLLKEEQSETDLLPILLSEYDTDAPALKRDLSDFLNMLTRLKLLQS